MKQMKRTELIQYIAETVLSYENLEVTSNILWDFMCDSNKIIQWTYNGNKDVFYIAIRKLGLETGSKEYVDERCAALGKPIHTIEIHKIQDRYADFEIREY